MTKATGRFEQLNNNVDGSGQSKNQVFHRYANRWATWDNISNTTYSSNEVSYNHLWSTLCQLLSGEDF